MKPTDEQIKAFKKDLQRVLEKHKAELWPNCDGDTFGIYNERIMVTFHVPDPSGRWEYIATEGISLGSEIHWRDKMKEANG